MSAWTRKRGTDVKALRGGPQSFMGFARLARNVCHVTRLFAVEVSSRAGGLALLEDNSFRIQGLILLRFCDMIKYIIAW